MSISSYEMGSYADDPLMRMLQAEDACDDCDELESMRTNSRAQTYEAEKTHPDFCGMSPFELAEYEGAYTENDFDEEFADLRF